MAASQYQLDNLCAVVDRNRLQISGTTETVMHQDDLRARFESFGWYVIETDGNDMAALDQAFCQARTIKGKPVLIIADTIKGRGVSFIENQAGWHHRVPSAEEYALAMKELDGEIQRLQALKEA